MEVLRYVSRFVGDYSTSMWLEVGWGRGVTQVQVKEPLFVIFSSITSSNKRRNVCVDLFLKALGMSKNTTLTKV